MYIDKSYDANNPNMFGESISFEDKRMNKKFTGTSLS